MFIGLLAVFLGFIHTASAGLLLGLMELNHDFLGMAFGHLSARQTQPLPNVPTECKPDCDPVNTKISQGCPPDDCCKAAFFTGTFNCLKCVGEAIGATDFSAGQAVLDNLAQACSARGFDVPKLTLPGANSTSSSATLSIRSTATVSRPPQTTVSVLLSAPPNTAPPPLTTPINQSTATAPLASSTPQGPPQIIPAPSGAKSYHFFTPHFSQLSTFIALVIGFAPLFVL